MSSTHEKVAIVGVGATEQGDLGGRSTLEVGAEALKLALLDAGITKDAVDGLVVFGSYGSHFPDVDIGSVCELTPNYSASLGYGTGNFSLHLANMAIETGLANTVAIVHR